MHGNAEPGRRNEEIQMESNFVMKKILYCESNRDGTVGGSFRSLLYLAEGVDRLRYQPLVIFYREHSLLDEYRKAGLRTEVWSLPEPIRIPFASSRRQKRNLLVRVLGVLQRLANFFQFVVVQAIRHAVYLRRHRIDLVHLNNSILRNHDWMLAALIANVRCVTHERGLKTHYPWLARFFAKRLDAVVCISQAVRDNLVARGVSGERLVIVHNGLDPERVRPVRDAAEVRAELGIGTDQPVLGILGNIRRWKGQETVVRAAAKIREQVPNVVCLLVGDTADADRTYEERLREIIHEERLEHHVLFTGYKKNVADYLNIMDIVVHASIDPEPFGRVLIEAMAMRKPVVGARGGAVPEIVVHGETGYLFTPGDWVDLATHATVLMRDPELCRRMGESGYRRMVSDFHIRTNVERTQVVYARVLADR